MDLKFEKGKNPKEAMNIGAFSFIPREKFIELFLEEVGCYMYDYVDAFDYSQGMEGVSKNRKKELASDLYDTMMEEINSKKESDESINNK